MIENIQKTKSRGHQSQERSKQLSSVEDVMFMDDVLNSIAKVKCPKSSQQSTSKTSMDDYCPFPEELAPHAFPSDWIYNA